MSLPSLVPLIGIADVIIGLSLGSRLFLIAVGLSLIFGVLGVLNFAHGGFYMLGAYVTLAVVTNVVDNFWLAVVAGALAVGVVGAAIEFAAIRPLYDRVDADLDQLIVTFGFVLVIHEAVRFIWGSGSYSIDPPDVFNFSVALGGRHLQRVPAGRHRPRGRGVSEPLAVHHADVLRLAGAGHLL